MSWRLPEMPATVSSPALLYLMEIAAYQTVARVLDEGDTTVGVESQFQHIASAPIGTAVLASAQVIQVDGNRIRFAVEIRDTKEILARGEHVRAVVNKERFQAKLRKKAELLQYE